MKNIFLVSLLLFSGGQRTENLAFINPTGTYLEKGEVKSGRIVGHYGEVRVRLLDTGRIALCFLFNTGYPRYESGSLIDTLHYEDNRAVYRPAGDSSCALHFVFGIRALVLSRVLTDTHSGCGFAPGAVIPAIFEKTSSDIPVIQDLSQHGSFK